MERDLKTGYETGYEKRLADKNWRILAVFGRIFRFNVETNPGAHPGLDRRFPISKLVTTTYLKAIPC